MRNAFFSGIILFSAALTACSVQTEPTTLGERSARADTDRHALFSGQEDIVKPLTLYDAIARAVKYNADHRVAAMEQAFRAGVADAASLDMLPKLAAEGGFSARSRMLAYSAKEPNGNRPLNDAVIGGKAENAFDLTMAFNVLDFGISYVNARQKSDRLYMAEEAHRKSLQLLIHDVRAAFWRAAAAQRIAGDVEALTNAVRQELVRVGDADDMSVEGLENKKRLLTTLQSLNQINQTMLTAKADLAALMNLPPNIPFTLDIPAAMDKDVPSVRFGQIDLEHFALINRPELRIGDYEVRLAKADAKKEMLRWFPGIEFGAGLNYNSNPYLTNSRWASAGIGVSWNLMNLFSRPSAVRAAEGKIALEIARRQAMTMAIISQVNISYIRLQRVAEDFRTTDALERVDARLWEKLVRNGATASAKNKAFADATERLRSHLLRDLSYAAYKEAESDLFMALGVDPLPQFSMKASLDRLAETLADNLSRNAPSGFKEVSYDNAPLEQKRKPSSVLSVAPQSDAASPDEKDNVIVRTGDGPVPLNKTAKTGKTQKADEDTLVAAPVAAARKKARNTTVPAPAPSASAVSKEPRLLQISSFETIEGAQAYWSELLTVDPSLSAYAPVFREVSVNGKTRYRTFVSDNESALRGLCVKLRELLKSCLITKQ